MGFTQTTKNPTGLETLWQMLRELSSPTDSVQGPASWKDDPEAKAGLVGRNTELDAKINVFAYSWGAGWFFPRFAQALQRWGRSIDNVVLCDPVYRSPRLLFRGRSLLNRVWAPSIRIPSNVRRVQIYRQKTDKPSGHRVIPIDPRRTEIVSDVLIRDTPHVRMDDLPEFHNLCLKLSREITSCDC